MVGGNTMGIKQVDNHTLVYAHPNFIKDKDSLFDRDPVTKKQYAKWLDKKLHLLESYGIQASLSLLPNDIEKMSGGKEDIYCLRRNKTTGNPRTLFITLIEDDNNEYYILLHAFKETSEGSYQRGLEVAKKRRKEVLDALKL